MCNGEGGLKNIDKTVMAVPSPRLGRQGRAGRRSVSWGKIEEWGQETSVGAGIS